MATAPKRWVANTRATSANPNLKAKPLRPASFERERPPLPPERPSGVHPAEPAATWWADGLAACESEEVCADLSKDPRREA
jgi:hypothetical protein